MNNYIAIMAGGIGSRFWPSSTSDRPKQFLDILGVGKSLLRMTFERSAKTVPVAHIYILTNRTYLELVKQHLPELPVENILCEPSMNNTAPAIAYVALKLQAMNPQAVCAILPSDHVILKEEIFLGILTKAFEKASTHDVLLTLGIQPTRPDTGYGYIRFEEGSGQLQDVSLKDDIWGSIQFYKVNAFKEKPNLDTAQKYCDSGLYLWNSGMFVWDVQAILKAFRQYAPQIVGTLSSSPQVFNTPDEQAYIDEVYPLTNKISIDYAIMEKADNVYTAKADIGWSDLGTWNSLHAYLGQSDDVVKVGQNIHLIDSKDIMVMSNNEKTIVIKGLHDYIVVDEENALLIYPKSDEQEIKSVVHDLIK